MVTCPWCGTNYATFLPNCSNCGGPLPWVDEHHPPAAADEAPTPPPAAPRPISDAYLWRLLTSDGGAIAALVFGILGLVFGVVGAVLTLRIITAFIGIPFLLLGLVFLAVAGVLFQRRYVSARQVVNVLRTGVAAPGEVVEIHQNFSVRVNGRYPWVIQYHFQANARDFTGTVKTFNPPGPQLQAGKAVYVLYLADAPQYNSIYPHP